MEGKQIEDREAVKAAVEALDAPPTLPPDGGVAPDPAPGIAESDQQPEDGSAASTLPPEEIERLTNDIVAALKTVYDPEIPADIYELGLIYKVEIDDDRNVVVNMTLTAPGCPVAGEMPIWVENAVNAVPGIAGTKVNIVFDPPWDQSRMSDEDAFGCRHVLKALSLFRCEHPYNDSDSKDTEARVPSLRIMPKVMTLTDAAAARVSALIAQKPGVKALKIGVKKGGCAGMEYTMTWAEEIGKFDEIVEDKGAVVLIDPAAIMYLIGTEMDYKTDKLSSQFVFNNPNQKSACGCGESVNLEPATPQGFAPVG